MPNITAVKGEPVVHSNEAGVFNLQEEIRATDSLGLEPVAASNGVYSETPEKKAVTAPEISLNKHATKYVQSFLKREDESLTLVKKRSKSYFSLIDTVFTKYRLPLELKYLAVIESELKTSAVSRVGAKGMWQLMPVTARELGLKVSKKNDERTHVYKSTVAAAKYLRDLYAEYGDWLLVIAAYNGGPGVVNKAIRKAGSKNFWALQQYLPMESRCHVKRFIGTHYYFEGKGSITTLTKTEAIAYTKAMASYTAAIEDEKAKEETAVVASTNR
jgi:membrane-bound lytic murein transglycosylase D